MFELQMTLLGLSVMVEVSYTVDADERGTFIELDEVWILGFYPEGLNSRNDYAPLMAKCNISALTKAEHDELLGECEADLEQLREIALERDAEDAYEARHG